MKLYHGSNVKVKNPRIITNTRLLDFGYGFYLTSDFKQAKKWAKLTQKRRQQGIATVSMYEISKEQLKNLKVLYFESANKEWLKFVTQNRSNNIINNENWDIIIGPVANDNTMPVINLYLNGIYDENEALKRLLPQNLKDQYTFKTEKSLKYLKFLEVLEL